MESFKKEKESIKNYSDDDLRSISEAKLEELKALVEKGIMPEDALKEWVELVKNGMTETELEKSILSHYGYYLGSKALDNGSVRGLILGGDYGEVGRSVYIQRITGDTVIWIKSHYGYPSSYSYTKEILNTNDDEWKSVEKIAKNVVTVCRRKFKKENIILMSITESDNPDGIVLTEDKIFSFSQGKPEYIITYDEIEEVDFTSGSVVIKTTEGDEAYLFCGNKNYSSDPECSKNMYNLIMDIKDRLEEA